MVWFPDNRLGGAVVITAGVNILLLLSVIPQLVPGAVSTILGGLLYLIVIAILVIHSIQLLKGSGAGSRGPILELIGVVILGYCYLPGNRTCILIGRPPGHWSVTKSHLWESLSVFVGPGANYFGLRINTLGVSAADCERLFPTPFLIVGIFLLVAGLKMSGFRVLYRY